MTNSVVSEIPGYVAGTWDIDPVCSEIGFHVSHFTFRKARGRFNRFTGTIVTHNQLDRSSVITTIDAATITTGGSKDDAHIRSDRFLDVEHFPNITFQSTAIHFEGSRFLVRGKLTIRDRTRIVVLEVQRPSFAGDFDGGTRACFNATTQISRNTFDIRPTGWLELADNALILGDTVSIAIRIEAVLQRSTPTANRSNGGRALWP